MLLDNLQTSGGAGAFRVTAASLLLLCFYAAIFYASADTPIAYASSLEWLQITLLSVAFSFSVAVLLKSVLWLVSAAWKSTRVREPAIGSVIAFVILFSLGLMVLENFSYTVFSWGLKTGTSVIGKIGMFAGCVFFAYQCLPLVSWFAKKLSPAILVSLTLLICLSLLIYSIFTPDKVYSDQMASKGSPGLAHPHVIFLTSDGLNASEMSVYGQAADTTPFLKSVASDFMVFNNAFPNSANTTGGITTMLTGRSPLTTQVVYPPDILKEGDELKHLPAFFSSKHYIKSQWAVPHYGSADSQNMFGAFDYVHGESQAGFNYMAEQFSLTSLQSWFATRLIKDQFGLLSDILFIHEMENPYMQVSEDSEKKKNRLRDEDRVSGLLQDIDTAVGLRKQLFNHTHFMNTHGSKFPVKERVFSKGVEQDKKWMREFYHDAILEFDGHVESIFNHLKSAGILDEVILVVSTDHGRRWSQSDRIPLLIRFPLGANAGLYSQYVQLTDVAPTILDYVGGSWPTWMSGVSLLNPQEIPANRIIFSVGRTKAIGKNEDGKVVRDNVGEAFKTANKFGAVFCGAYTGFTFPDPKFNFVKTFDEQPVSGFCDISATQKGIKILDAFESHLAH